MNPSYNWNISSQNGFCKLKVSKDGKTLLEDSGHNIQSLIDNANNYLREVENKIEYDYQMKKKEYGDSLVFTVEEKGCLETDPPQMWMTGTLSYGDTIVRGSVNSWNKDELERKLFYILIDN